MIDKAKIIKNVAIASDIYLMELQTPLARLCKAGQFIELQVPGHFLRRPISIASIDDDRLTIIYKVIGSGTKMLSTLKDNVSIVGPLGNGFLIEDKEEVLLVGGGIGVPPLYELAKAYRKKGTNVKIVMGFLNQEQVILVDEFKKLEVDVYVACDDGSYGIKGNVLDAIKQAGITCDYLLACGPLGMLKALKNRYHKGYFSMEQRMACGIGACMGCTIKMVDGNVKRVCKDGPVFAIEEVEL